MVVMAIVFAIAKQLDIGVFLAHDIDPTLIRHSLQIAIDRGQSHALTTLREQVMDLLSGQELIGFSK